MLNITGVVLKTAGALVLTPVLVLGTLATVGTIGMFADKLNARKLDKIKQTQFRVGTEIKAITPEEMNNEFAEINKSIDDLNEKCKNLISTF